MTRARSILAMDSSAVSANIPLRDDRCQVGGVVLQRSRFKLYTFFAAVVALVTGPSFSAPSAGRIARPVSWVSSWGSAQIPLDPKDARAARERNTAPTGSHVDRRRRVRIHISNVFGAGPLTITGVHIARAPYRRTHNASTCRPTGVSRLTAHRQSPFRRVRNMSPTRFRSTCRRWRRSPSRSVLRSCRSCRRAIPARAQRATLRLATSSRQPS